MSWDSIREAWDDMKDKVKEEWSELTDDDVDEVRGDRDLLAGKLHDRYGWDRPEAERRVDDWEMRNRHIL